MEQRLFSEASVQAWFAMLIASFHLVDRTLSAPSILSNRFYLSVFGQTWSKRTRFFRSDCDTFVQVPLLFSYGYQNRHFGA